MSNKWTEVSVTRKCRKIVGKVPGGEEPTKTTALTAFRSIRVGFVELCRLTTCIVEFKEKSKDCVLLDFRKHISSMH